MFFANLVLIYNVCSVGVFAGGVDKKETLSDGTELIYVSTENIDQVLSTYELKEK